MKKPVKTLVATGAAGALTLALGTSAFASERHHSDPGASSKVQQSAHVHTDQSADSNSGGNDVGNHTRQKNWDTSGSASNTSDDHARLGTGSSAASNTASTSVGQTNSSTVSNAGPEDLSIMDDHHDDNAGATSTVDQSAHVSTDQTATSDSGDNNVGNSTHQSNADTSSGASNSATGSTLP